MTLKGRIGIVTGADTEAGRAIAEALASYGLSLMLLAHAPSRLFEMADELAARHGIRCFAAVIDIADPAAVDRILMHVEQHLGPIDVVVSLVPGVLAETAMPTMAARGRGHMIHIDPSTPGSSATNVTVVRVEVENDPAAVARRVLDSLLAPD